MHMRSCPYCKEGYCSGKLLFFLFDNIIQFESLLLIKKIILVLYITFALPHSEFLLMEAFHEEHLACNTIVSETTQI